MKALVHMVAPLRQRIAMMIGRAVISAIDDSKKLQSLQIDLLEDETQDDVEHFQPYGVASRAHPGAEAIMLGIGGLRSHGVVIAVADRRYRLKNLAEGEVALYDDLDQVVHLKRDGILIKSPLKVVLEAPEVTVISDNVDLGGTGGARVARVGDTVAGGVITGGSTKVRAA